MRHPLYLIEQGSRLGVSGRRLLITLNEQTLSQVAVLNISEVIVYGNVQVTTPAIRLLTDEGIPLVFLSLRGRFYGRLSGPMGGHSALRVAQVLAAHDPPYALHMMRAIVSGKLHNLRVFLQRYARRLTDAAAAQAVGQAADGISALLPSVARAGGQSRLLGLEGQAAALYFGVWPHLLQPPFTFEKRIRRPPTDPVNVVISFLYTLVTQQVESALLTAGLDPYVGFLHALDYNRPSLALDLVEEFRPIVADSIALRCLNNAILTPDDFVSGDVAAGERPLLLTPDGVRRLVRELETRLAQSFKHPQTGEQVTYRRLFLLQAYALARAVQSHREQGGGGGGGLCAVPRALRCEDGDVSCD